MAIAAQRRLPWTAALLSPLNYFFILLGEIDAACESGISHFGSPVDRAGVYGCALCRQDITLRDSIFQMNTMRDKIALLLLLMILAAPFTQVFFMTADDLLYYYYILSGDWGRISSAIQQTAVGQGRLGQYLSVPLYILGNYMADGLIGRIFIVALFFLAFVVLFMHVDQIYRTKITPLATIVLFAITPLSAHHFPPNSYPVLISLPLFGLGCIRIAAYRRVTSDNRGMLGYVALSILFALFMLSYEYAMVIGGMMVVAMHLEWWTNDPKAYLNPHTAVRTMLKMDVGAFVIMSVIYLGYAFIHPSHYDGNQPGAFHIMKILKVLTAHIFLGPSPYYLIERPGWMEMICSAKMAAVPGAMVLVASSLLAARSIDLIRTKKIYQILIFGFVLSLAVVLPNAVAEKYQRWCLENGDCAYIDSRLSLIGISLVISAIMAAVMKLSEKRRVRNMMRLSMSCIIGLLCASTFLFNVSNIAHIDGNQNILNAIALRACSDRKANLVSDKNDLLGMARDIPWHDWTPEPRVTREEFILRYYRTQYDKSVDCK